MRREEPLRAPHSITSGDLTHEKPYWNYEDVGVFFLILVLLGYFLRVFVRFHLLPRSELNNPSVPLQFALVASLSWLCIWFSNSVITDRCCTHWVGFGDSAA